MKANPVFILVLTFLTISAGYVLIKFTPALSRGLILKDVKVVAELPFEIESKNPVSEVRHWNRDGRTFYYFNWGLKPTGGYSLKLLGVRDKKIELQAVTPGQDQMVIQVITYPYLLLSLPEGNYDYEVVDREGKPVKDIFTPKNPPLKLTLFLPGEAGRIAERQVFRDPYLNTEGKTTGQIALEALFCQEEMADLVENEILVEGVSFSTKDKKWYVMMSKGFEMLEEAKKTLLSELISKTVMNVKTKDMESVTITTHKAGLPELEN